MIEQQCVHLLAHLLLVMAKRNVQNLMIYDRDLGEGMRTNRRYQSAATNTDEQSTVHGYCTPDRIVWLVRGDDFSSIVQL